MNLFERFQFWLATRRWHRAVRQRRDGYRYAEARIKAGTPLRQLEDELAIYAQYKLADEFDEGMRACIRSYDPPSEH